MRVICDVIFPGEARARLMHFSGVPRIGEFLTDPQVAGSEEFRVERVLHHPHDLGPERNEPTVTVFARKVD